VITPGLSPNGALIQGVETRFPWFLLATLLPILAMPFTNLDGIWPNGSACPWWA
jgi:hypothetical protein